MNSAFSFLAAVATRHPWKVLAVWGLIMVAAAPFALRFEGTLTSAGWDVGGSESKEAHDLIEQELAPNEAIRAVIARHRTVPFGAGILARGRWRADAGFEHHPVVEVSFRGASEYCARSGKRLPTEAEWEKAARGADGRRYPWGNEAPDATRARFAAAYNATVPVGSHAQGASPYGVLDMAGNVWQWTSSLYRPYPYRAGDGREDARSPEIRATRGGAHDWPAEGITATHRGGGLSRSPAAGHHNIGFRCAR